MKLGLTLPSFQREPDQVLVVARAAEAAGLDGVFVYDHLFRVGDDGHHRPSLEAVAMLGAVATGTTRVTLGTLVTRASLRPSASLLAAFATVARIAPGRVVVGIGSGDSGSQAENRAFGLADSTVKERVAMLRRAVDGLVGHGFPVWVGGTSAGVRRVAAAAADGWNRWGSSAATFGRELASLGPGRRPDFTASWGGLVVVGDDAGDAAARAGATAAPDTIVGGPDEVAARLVPYVAAGADWLVLGPVDARDPGQATRIGEQVAPRLRAARPSS